LQQNGRAAFDPAAVCGDGKVPTVAMSEDAKES
jgi:hypothetical protein